MSSIIFCAYFIVATLVFIIVAIRKHAEFNRGFPPISDAQFVARCRPDTDPEIALKVRRFIAENLGAEYERIYPSSSFKDMGIE